MKLATTMAVGSLGLAAVAGTFGVATAAERGSSTVIHACYTSTSGDLRVSSGGCKQGEKAIAWNQQGPRGRRGVAGAAGHTGSAGPAGPMGSTGAPGPIGATGTQGPAGPAGATGPSDAWFITGIGTSHGVSLQPGSYIATGNVYVSGAADPSCSVYHTTTASGAASGKNGEEVGPSTKAISVPLSDAFTVTIPTSLAYVTCSVATTADVEPLVTIIKVGTLH